MMMDEEYREFIDRKSQLDAGSGFDPIVMPGFLFDFQASLVDWACRMGRAAIFADCGMGKGMPPVAPVLTPSGWRPIGELSVGDKIVGRDGRFHCVTGVYIRGEQDAFRITFSDGCSMICDDDHLWAVRSTNDSARERSWRVMATRDLRASPLKYGSANKSRTWRIPLVDPIEFNGVDLPLHPYVLGILLGHGSLEGTPSWSAKDPEIADQVSEFLPPNVTVVRHEYPNKVDKWAIVNDPRNPHVKNPVMVALGALGLVGLTGTSKFVPRAYLLGSASARTALLQGLMDTNGYCGDPTPEFSNCSKHLADAVVWLVQSLGGIASTAVKAEPSCMYLGERRIGQPSYRVTMLLPPGITPFLLPRKADRYRPTSRGLGRWIDRIESIGRLHTVCISTDAPDQLFVTTGCIVTHNTPMQLVWADNIVRKTNLPALILAPLSVSQQTVEEAQKFDIDAARCMNGTVGETRIYVTNYERLHHFRPDDFGGIVCDESSIIKNFDGARKGAITEFMKKVRYRLLCTATAAPNDYIELGTSSEALGYLGFMDMLGTFFKNDEDSLHPAFIGSKWRFKRHAEQRFWRWMASWARACRKPSDLGFDDRNFVLPKLIENEHVVRSAPLDGFLFDLPAITLAEQQAETRETIKPRCEKAAELLSPSRCGIAWAHLNAEADLLEKLIPGAVQVRGGDSDDRKEEVFLAFRRGQIRKLVTKPKIASLGMNWQHCAHMTWFTNHSYEQKYQATRRCWRYGQIDDVVIDNIGTTSQAGVSLNVRNKAHAADRMFEEMVRHMGDAAGISRMTSFGEKVEVAPWL